MKRVLITIDIDNFQRENSKESMIDASSRWGAHFLPFTRKHYGDTYGTTFNKAILDLIAFGYDEMMFIDADCIIRSDAPNPFDMIKEDKITAVQNGNERIGNYPNTLNQHLYNLLRINQQRQMLEIIERPDIYFNTGFMVAKVSTMRRLCHLVRTIMPELGYDRYNPIYEQALFNYASRCINPNLDDPFVSFVDETWNYMYPSSIEQQTKWIYHISNDVSNRNEIIDKLQWRV
jgi:lipopolysaccharide biosynthesis glycosyltransferase